MDFWTIKQPWVDCFVGTDSCKLGTFTDFKKENNTLLCSQSPGFLFQMVPRSPQSLGKCGKMCMWGEEVRKIQTETCCKWKKGYNTSIRHRIHVWYIYIHLYLYIHWYMWVNILYMDPLGTSSCTGFTSQNHPFVCENWGVPRDIGPHVLKRTTIIDSSGHC